MPQVYNIRAGDSLSAIAARIGTTVDAIIGLNPQIENPNLIFPGQSILVPDGSIPKDFHRKASEETDPGDHPTWYKIARREIGVREISGPQHEQRVLEYLATCESLPAADRGKDETAWCSAFVNWCVEQAGVEGTNSAWARSWNDVPWGEEEDRAAPRVGSIVVFRRFNSNTDGGHVGFFVADKGSKVRVLGGNQSNSVREQDYPKDGFMNPFNYKLLGYRWAP